MPQDIAIWGERKPLLLRLELVEEWEGAVPWRTPVMIIWQATAGEVHPAGSCTESMRGAMVHSRTCLEGKMQTLSYTFL